MVQRLRKGNRIENAVNITVCDLFRKNQESLPMHDLRMEMYKLGNILIIDDDIHIGNILAEALTKDGYQVMRAYSGMMIDTYSNDYLSKVFDTKHGAGSSEYIVKAFRYYSENNCTENN